MALLSSGIFNVTAFALPAGIRQDGSIVTEPNFALVRWQSDWNGKLYQIYINGRYAGTTTDTNETEKIIQLPSAYLGASKIEVYAVEAGSANTDLSSELPLTAHKNGQIKLCCLKSQNLAMGGKINLYSNAGSGEINYDEPLDEQHRIWAAWQDKGGFGLSKFGKSDFGYDGSAAVGFGKGVFGQDDFGFDADQFNWTSPQLETGSYKFGIKIEDSYGNISETAESEERVIIQNPIPAYSLEVNSFDKDTNQLVLDIE